MRNKRLVRLHLTNGLGIFTNGNVDNLSLEEFEDLMELEQDLDMPRLDENDNFSFYFTLKGFRKHKQLLKLIIKGHSPQEDCKLSRVWVKDCKIIYQDDEQGAIL